MSARGVQQQDPKGCGVAAVATVTGRSYAQVRRRALRAGHWRANYGMNGGMLERLLDSYRRPVHRITMGRVPGYPVPGRTAIVKVIGLVPCVVWRNGKAEQRRRLWQHWVVWHAGTVWDPGCGVLWDGAGAVGGGGLRLYLASVQSHEAKVSKVRTGRWHWI